MKLINNIIIAIFCVALISSCADEGKNYSSTITGKVGEVGVVLSKADWDSEVGNAVRDVMAAEFPYLPQVEPKFNLFNIPPASMSSLFQSHRNLVFVNIADTCEASLKMLKDKWAQPQTILMISAPDRRSAVELILSEGDRICNVFENAERDRYMASARNFEEVSIRESISARMGGSPCFPQGYAIKKQAQDFFWVSYETTYTNQIIFLYKYPFEGNNRLIPKYIVEKRDSVMKVNVPAMSEGSYVITNPLIIPGFAWKSYGGQDFAELRSLWETEGDFMGGPFVSHSFISPDSTSVVVVEGFVYAPKYRKRDYLRQVESIVYSFKWNDK